MSVVTELGAGFLLIVGLLTPFACAAVISVMLIAGLLAHRRNGFFVFKDGYEYVLALSVVAPALAVIGPGRSRWTTLLEARTLDGQAAALRSAWPWWRPEACWPRSGDRSRRRHRQPRRRPRALSGGHSAYGASRRKLRAAITPAVREPRPG
jgi:hypothetical protein